MAEVETATSTGPSVRQRIASSPLRRWWPFAAAVGLGLLATGTVNQLLTPYVRRDDWPYLLPLGSPGGVDPYFKVEQEGRWLNVAWWYLVGQHGTTVTAMATYLAAYILFVAGVWRLFRMHGAVAGFLLAAALFLSPLWFRLFYWPGTLTAPVVVAAAAVWLLPTAARRQATLALWVFGATVLAALSYPPVAAVLVLAAVVHLRDRPWRDIVLLLVGFGVSLAVGTLLAFGLNWLAFGRFGVEVAVWRSPNPLTSLHDLRVNAGRYARQFRAIWVFLGWASVAGAVAWALALVDSRVRPQVLRVLLALAVVVGIECAQTLVTGVRVAVRGSLWAWFALVIPAGLLLEGSTWARRAAYACLAVLGTVGLLSSRGDVVAHQQTQREIETIAAGVARARADDPGRPVVLFQQPAERRTTAGGITAGSILMSVYEATGARARWCRPAECAQIAARTHEGPVLDLGPVTAVVVPPPPDWL